MKGLAYMSDEKKLLDFIEVLKFVGLMIALSEAYFKILKQKSERGLIILDNSK